jgi:hypothetical protein
MLARILTVLQSAEVPHHVWDIHDQPNGLPDEGKHHGFALVVGPDEDRAVEFIFDQFGNLVSSHLLTLVSSRLLTSDPQ